jgi:gamma-glutamyltranspeptidase / glutathione hydrolase
VKGAIAAGHPLTAEAGARVLAEGGNAVDACVAAAFASWVAESPLTGPGGGGFMLVHRARDSSTRLLDFFAAVPGLDGAGVEGPEMTEIEVGYEPGGGTQIFDIGAASCAVPGMTHGLEEAHRAFGSVPWRALVEPAAELARNGVLVTEAQAYLHVIVDLILRHTDEGKRVYELDGKALVEGDTLVQGDLARTLETIADEGAAGLRTGELGRALVEFLREEGGPITERDLADYRVIRRRPIQVRYGGCQVLSNPPPSSGGVLIGYGLLLLDRLGLAGPPGSAEAIAQLVEIARQQNRVRERGFTKALYRGGLAAQLHSAQSVAAAVERIHERLPAPAEPAAAKGTTHISVVDAQGNAASLSATIGAGSGLIVPGTGIHLNNMLGELDLASVTRPGARITSMMAPSLVLQDGRPRVVLGSAGSERLRGAIIQVVANTVGHGMGVEEAIGRPRVHLDEPTVQCEGGADPAELDRLASWGYEVVRWKRRNLYFGGVAAVEMLEDGSLSAAGDPRRGGAEIVVE